MNHVKDRPSSLERWIVGALDLVSLVLLVVWVVNCNLLQIVFILAALALALLAVLSVAAWRHGFRWFFTRRGLRFGAWLVAGIISLIVLFYAEEGWRGRRAWASLQREATARGESLDLASVIPPPVPDAENFALAPGVAAVLGYTEPAGGQARAAEGPEADLATFKRGRHDQRPIASWEFQQATDLAAWQKFVRQHPLTNSAPASPDADQPAFPVAPTPQAPAADVLLALSRYDPALAVLREAGARPLTRYPLPYEDGLFALHRRKSRFEDNLDAAVSVLCLRAVSELAQDRGEAALADTLLAVRLADSLRQEPYGYFHHVRAAMLRRCLQPVWEGLARHRWNEAQLAALQQRFAGMDLLAEFRLRARGETLITMNIADQFLAYLEGRGSAWGRELASVRGDDLYWLWAFRIAYPVGWLYQDKVWVYRFYEQRSDVFKALATANRGRWKNELRSATDPALLIMVVPRLMEVFHDGAPGSAYVQAACQEAAVACALERCRLAQGQYPVSLEALVPAWLKQVPADLLDPDGAPLRYRREANGGFTLYAVGLNRVDDQGKPAPPEKDWRGLQSDYFHLDIGDWAWVQPGQL